MSSKHFRHGGITDSWEQGTPAQRPKGAIAVAFALVRPHIVEREIRITNHNSIRFHTYFLYCRKSVGYSSNSSDVP
jgi:hypothetical protein